MRFDRIRNEMDQARENNSALTLLIVMIMSAIAILLLSGFSKPALEVPDKTNQKTVTIFAAAGTNVAIEQIVKHYEKQTGCKVITNFASSSTLARQISAGAEFDIYISANSKWMDFVEEKKLIDSGTRKDLLFDRLALIAPADIAGNFRDQTIEQILLNTTGPVALGDPAHVPVGLYTKEALQTMGCWMHIQDRIVPSLSVQAAQLYVETGQCQLGVVYQAGASQSQKVKILHLFDETLHTPIRFSVAMASNSPNGKELLEFLRMPAAQQIFTNAGFSVLSGTDDDPLKKNINTSSLLSAFNVNEWQAFLISVKVAATCVLVVAAPGILLGYILASKSFPGRSFVNAFVHLPMVIPPVVTGYLALVFLGKNSLLGGFLERIFSISFAFNWLGAVLVASIMGFPLLVRSVKTAVEMIDSRYRYAANTLGANPVRTFFTITLPLAGPGILAGLILAFARSLGEFGATAVFAGNIPGKTQTLSLAIYNFMQIPGAESSAVRLVVISIIISFAAMLGSEILLQKMKALSGVRS